LSLISFDDAVTAANLRPNQLFAVYYADGRFANRTAVAARCPKAKLFGITVRGLTGKGIFACDCESGDLTVAQAIVWTEEQIKLHVDPICVYASLSVWTNQGLLAGIQRLEKKYGVKIKKWVAHYNNVAQIPSWADADQFADPGPVDHDIALANFFSPSPPAHKADTPHGTARAIISVDLATNKLKSVHGLPGFGVHFGGPAHEIPVNLRLQVGKGGGKWQGA
jgi:hypothetical protein